MLYVIAHNILRLLFGFLYRLEAVGLEKIPQTGGVVLCCNHISNLDPPILGTPLKRRIYYMAKEELFRIPVFGAMITSFGAFPVKRGGVGKESIRLSLRMLQEGKLLGIFPEGSRKTPGQAKKGAAGLALRSGAPVHPAAIVGTYRPFSKVVVIYGGRIDLTAAAGESESERLEAATALIMNAIRELQRDYSRQTRARK